MTSTEVDITIASDPSSNGHNISLGDHFSYIVSDHLNFLETPALTALIIGSFQEETVVPPVLDLIVLNIVYRNMTQQ